MRRRASAPIPREQVVDVAGRVFGDAGEDIGQPDLRIDIVHLGGDDQAVHHRGALPAAIGAGEEPRFSAQSNREVILPVSGRK